MIYLIKDGRYSGEHTLAASYTPAYVAEAAARGYECACWEDSETPISIGAGCGLPPTARTT